MSKLGVLAGFPPHQNVGGIALAPYLAIATCREFPGLIEDDRPILEGLAARGVRADVLDWRAHVDWRRYRAVLLRSVWDYFHHPAEFAAWLDRLEGSGVSCWNPAPLVRWNMDKRYLRDLEARGVRTVPTLFVDADDVASGAEAGARVAETDWPELVVKPTVSGGAWRTLRLRREDAGAHAAALEEILSGSGLMVQPYLPEIAERGEWSLLFFEGVYSHAVVKRPRDGDFRVQWTHGGAHVPTTPSASIVSQAREILAAAPSSGLYARVDGVERDGRLVLMELEQIEPFLFLAGAPGASERFVDALCARLRNEDGARPVDARRRKEARDLPRTTGSSGPAS